MDKAKARRISLRIGTVVFCVALFFVLLFNCFEQVCFNLSRYEKSYDAWNIPARTGMSKEDLMDVTQEMLKYLLGQREALDMEATIHGELRPVFGEREVLHMVDVQKLFLGGVALRRVGYALLIASVLVMAIGGVRDALRVLPSSWFWVLGIMGGIVAGIALYFAIDFDTAFTQFHLLFFDNDLWLLDPRYEVLIQMFDSDFFYRCVMAIALFFLGGLALMSGLCVFLKIMYKRIDRQTGEAAPKADQKEATGHA